MAKKNANTGTDRVFLQNSIKTLVANIRFASVDNPVSNVVVTSSIPNEGKTTISVNLAQAMATSGKRTLLVDCDLRRRSVANELGVHGRYGLYSVLAGQVALEDAVVATGTPKLDFLDCEPHIPNPVDILASRRFRSFMDGLAEKYDFVVFDTPPLSTFVDAAVIGSIADATLLVVRQNFTKRDDVLAAYQQLQKAEANVIGTVLNFCESEKSEYYYSYYNKEGKKVRKRDAEPATGAGVGATQLPPMRRRSNAAQGEAASPAAAASVATPTPTSAPAQPAAVPAQSQQAGLKPLPTAGKPTPDSTAAFIANYTSRYDE